MTIPTSTRSTQAWGFVHFGGDLVAGVEGGRGVRLRSTNSTTAGAQGAVEPWGDDTDIDLFLSGKGTGGVFIGSTSGDQVLAVNSTSSTFSNAAISSGQIAELTFASTTFNVNPGDLVNVYTQSTLGAAVIGGWRLNATDSSRLTVLLAVPGSTASATLSGTINVVSIDLT